MAKENDSSKAHKNSLALAYGDKKPNKSSHCLSHFFHEAHTRRDSFLINVNDSQLLFDYHWNSYCALQAHTFCILQSN